MDASEVAARFNLEPLPVEGGFFRQIWRSPVDAEQPTGTAIIAMLTDTADGFSQFHRLPTDELWHFYSGDALELVLLEAGGTSRHVLLGADLEARSGPGRHRPCWNVDGRADHEALEPVRQHDGTGVHRCRLRGR